MTESPKVYEESKRRIIASFSHIQLMGLKDQIGKIDLGNDDLKGAIDAIEPNSKKARRLYYGISVIKAIYAAGNRSLNGLYSVLIWKTGPKETDFKPEWKYYEGKFKVPEGFGR